jgi:hypothetical protein
VNYEGVNRYLAKSDARLGNYTTYFENITPEKKAQENFPIHEMLDKWIEFIEDSRTEAFLDKQCWAFINGYSK